MLFLGPQAQAQTLKVLHSFTGGTDGIEPEAGVVRDTAGNLYGTTVTGGLYNNGTVYKVDSNGNETVLHAFLGGADGAEPYGGVILDGRGNLYGTTWLGGTYDLGIVFKLDVTGRETILYNFKGGSDGSNPAAGLVRDSAGNLYGTTYWGGDVSCGNPIGCGTVFKLSASGSEAVLHAFAATPDGGYPESSLTLDASGNLYGTTTLGGASGAGTVFESSPDGVAIVLRSFNGKGDGKGPVGGVIRDSVGYLYGTTNGGGAPISVGAAFQLDSSGTETVLHKFNIANGANPFDSLLRDASGNLYGTALYGGGTSCNRGYGCGVLFKLDSTGKQQGLYLFTGGADGAHPYSGLIMDASGNLYGTTTNGGDQNYGVVFEFIP
jgi:uncharacterized repeat protein (TIGR03803 family)